MPDYKLYFCKTPQDYVKLYKDVPGSCMGIKEENLRDIRGEIYRKTKLWSSVFYHYLPGVTGVGLKLGAKFVARGMTYREGRKKYYSEFLYGMGHVYRLKDMLEEAKYEYGDYIKFTKTFTIPGILYNKEYYCPIPYWDIIEEDVWISFNPKTNKYTVSPTKLPGSTLIYDTYAYSNFVKIERQLGPLKIV